MEKTKKSNQKVESEFDVLKKTHQFVREEEPRNWEERVANNYYDQLYKEYCIADLTKYNEGKIAMRWRKESEVKSGKGSKVCGSIHCIETKGLVSWEVNFAYVEQEQKKNALVKLRLCEMCSFKLNYKKQQKRSIDK